MTSPVSAPSESWRPSERRRARSLLPGEQLGNVRRGSGGAAAGINPVYPYAGAKVYAYGATRNYRESYNLFADSGILFNHESPRRGETFVTRKITRAVARITAGSRGRLYPGTLDAQREWGCEAT